MRNAQFLGDLGILAYGGTRCKVPDFWGVEGDVEAGATDRAPVAEAVFNHPAGVWRDRRAGLLCGGAEFPSDGDVLRGGAGPHRSICREDPADHRVHTSTNAPASVRGGSELSCGGRPLVERHRVPRTVSANNVAFVA